jgi:hypothetical protein
MQALRNPKFPPREVAPPMMMSDRTIIDFIAKHVKTALAGSNKDEPS